ncbi:response regulator transcription factor [Lysinibacillus sp. 54212]|uniref:response regulator transcription factor n=1 Tax=Lysinibacillus sp. 54212 TaxID=3119829 RepID=UPI002FC5813C
MSYIETETRQKHLSVENEKLQMLFTLQQAYVKRAKRTFSIVLLRWHPSSEFPSYTKEEEYNLLYDYIAGQVRNSDSVFKHENNENVIILLAFSGQDEAMHFLNRIISQAPSYLQGKIPNTEQAFLATVSEIANSTWTLEEVLEMNTELLSQTLAQDKNTVLTIDNFATPEVEEIKVSIVENNEITTSILKNLLSHTDIPNYSLDIKTFEDGFEFLESNWYKSGHTHIVLLNDILPRKNGIEVMNYLRSLPNDEKYIIMLISKRSTEEAVMYAFDNGADAFFTRPFNLRLVETQIKNILRRLRQ